MAFGNQANEHTIKSSVARRVGVSASSWDVASGLQTPAASGLQSGGSRSHLKFTWWKRKPSLLLVSLRRTLEDSQQVSRSRAEGEGQGNLSEAAAEGK